MLRKFFVLTAVLFGFSCGLFIPSLQAESSTEDQPKLILIHLDGVSYAAMMDEIEEGNLPNIKELFLERGGLEKALTYYPSKTPFVISSIRNGAGSDEGDLVGWDIPEYDDENSLEISDSFLKMAGSKHRVARASLLHGLPPFYWMNRFALMNTLDLFDTYPVQEFYFYKVDSEGHFRGEENYIEAIREFDELIGKFMSRLDEDINVVIYSDHGMVMGEPVKVGEQVHDKVGDQIKVFSYPTLYLNDGVNPEPVAKKIVAETDLKFAFFQKDESTVKGFFNNSTLYFHYADGKVRYSHEGYDGLGYYENGYNGEYLSRNEWMELTINFDYPATPIKVYRYLQNPNAGEIVTSLDNQKFKQTGYGRRGNHGGFSATDVVVPVMVYGPDVDHIGKFEHLWLEDLYRELDQFTFKQEPSRDTHYLSSRYNLSNQSLRTVAAISPAYRFRFGADFESTDFDGIDLNQVWGKYDIFRSHLARVWVGGGVDFSGDDTVGMFKLNHELRIRNFSANTTITTARNNQFTLAYDLNSLFRVELTNFNSVGFRLSL